MADNTTYCKVPEEKQYTEQVRRWSRNTRANGDEMGADIEKLLNNDAYLKEHLEELDGNAVKDGDKGIAGGVATLDDDGKLVQHVEYGNVDNVPAPEWDKIEGKPTSYSPSSHRHNKSEVGLEDVDNTADSDKKVAYAAKAGDADTVDGKNASAFAPSSHSHDAATQSAAGLMSTTDKKKLDGIANGANVTPSGLMSGYVRTGQKTGSTIGQYATAAGYNCTATKLAAVAYGYGCNAAGECAFAVGAGGEATANYAVCLSGGGHAEAQYSLAAGCETVAGYICSATFGDKTHATGSDQLVCGHSNDSSGGLFIIGNGSPSAPSNAFRVQSDGTPYGKKAYNTSGADYAEYFEWEDGNAGEEDRRGYFVTMEEDKIKKASSKDDYILGVISGKPSVIGNSDPDDWHGHFLVDEFGNFILQKTKEKRKERHFEDVEEPYLDEDGTEKIRLIPKMTEEEVEYEVESYVLNPEYDPSKPYIPRAERKEWAAVGMLGVLLVRDDGTCQVNGYCKVTDGGIATASEIPGWRVIARVNEHLVKIVFR